MRLGWAVLGLCALCHGAAGADSAPYPALRDGRDPALEAQVSRTLERLGLARHAQAGRLSMVLAEITEPRRPRVAAVNGDRMFYAASLPKLAILLGAFVEVEAGRMQLDETTSASLTRMIRQSSNLDATYMLNRVGRARVLEILQSERFGFYDPAVGGGIWVGKEYGRSPAYQRDPLHRLSHGANAMQVARFYYLLATDRLVAPGLGARMKQMLSEPALRHKFVEGLAGRPDVRLYRKSGTWRHWHADSALVEVRDRRYILVALAEHPEAGRWLVRLAGPMHDLIAGPPRAPE